MSEELKPCPFCGGTEAFVERLDYSAAYVQCDSSIGEHCACLARGPVGVQDDDGEETPGGAAAIRAWNRRAPAEPAPASTGRIPVVESANLVTIRTRLKGAAQAGAPITLSGLAACALYYAMDTGKPMASDDPAPVAARELDVEAERRGLTDEQIEEFCKSRGARWNGDYWIIEDADLHPLIRAARSAAQSTAPSNSAEFDGIAPVSTEQAGDARDAARYRHIKADNHRCADNTFCLFLDLDGNLLPVASADMDAEIDAAMLEAAPSPNNSPVGADKEP